MTEAVGLLIGGDRIATASRHPHVYPGTGSVNATVALAGPDEIDRAVTVGGEAQLPFGGMKGTGVGPREQGRYAVEFYTTVKTSYTLPG